MIDLFQDLINFGIVITSIHIHRDCIEIDTISDLKSQVIFNRTSKYYNTPTNQDNNLKFLISNKLNLTQQFGVKNMSKKRTTYSSAI